MSRKVQRTPRVVDMGKFYGDERANAGPRPEFAVEHRDRVFVGKLRKSVNAEDLHQEFVRFGTILESKILLDKRGRSKGYGFVRFAREEEAQELLQKNIPIYIAGKKAILGAAVQRGEKKEILEESGNETSESESESEHERNVQKDVAPPPPTNQALCPLYIDIPSPPPTMFLQVYPTPLSSPTPSFLHLGPPPLTPTFYYPTPSPTSPLSPLNPPLLTLGQSPPPTPLFPFPTANGDVMFFPMMSPLSPVTPHPIPMTPLPSPAFF